MHACYSTAPSHQVNVVAGAETLSQLQYRLPFAITASSLLVTAASVALLTTAAAVATCIVVPIAGGLRPSCEAGIVARFGLQISVVSNSRSGQHTFADWMRALSALDICPLSAISAESW